MKLWYLSQEEKGGYDTYSDCVVAAENEHDAKRTSPDECRVWDENDEQYFQFSDGRRTREDSDTWATHPDNVTVQLIGEANKGTKRGVICASFHAG